MNRALLALLVTSIAACSAQSGSGRGPGRRMDADAGRPADAGPAPGRDAGRSVPSADLCGDGLDQDLDGRVDEGCPCDPGDTASCYAGDPVRAGVGACVLGTMTCDAAAGEFGSFGPCTGSGEPSDESCDGVDEDCDGLVDEGTDPGTPCGAAVGVCMPGVEICADGRIVCSGAGAGGAEICDNGLDDDCDGEVDEGCICLTAGTAPWQQYMDEDVHCFGRDLDEDEREFEYADIPSEGSGLWDPRPILRIDFDDDSTIPGEFCDGSHTGGVFTYFQTFIDIPAGFVVRSLRLSLAGSDDGVQAWIFNSRHPGGATEWHVFDGGDAWELAARVAPGRNRIVLIHIDDNPTERQLSGVALSLNGGLLEECE